MKFKSTLFADFISLIYPQVCPACGVNLHSGEGLLCLKCMYHLPLVEMDDAYNNPVAKLFWGRIQIEMAASLFYYQKGSRYQNILHQLKYKGKKYIGPGIGEIFGHKLKKCGFSSIDVILPVPLHPLKQKKRGFNQSELIAAGISRILNKPVNCNSLKRKLHSETQTQRSRFERWKNVEGIFEVSHPERIKNKHVLIIDDVITTGSTLESCAYEILKLPGTSVSVATVGLTKMN